MAKTRINEHRRDYINKNPNSAIFDHCSDNQHSFNFHNYNILDREGNKFKREFSELLYIYI